MAALDARFAAFRDVTSYVRPPHSHGCPPVEVVPGVWTAHYHDIDAREKLQAAAPPTTLVVNAATADKCPVGAVSYGEGIEVLCVDGLLDDPEPLKKVDAMPQGAEKDAARAALPAFAPEECAGDAYKDFERVNAAIAKEVASGGAAMVHCYASLSRSVVFILAYLMKTRGLTAAEAAALMKSRWDATWPNDSFVTQLLRYEDDLRGVK